METKFISSKILKGVDGSEDLGVDGSIILEWIVAIRVGWCGLDESGSR
jgi:hypothetical protein